MKRSEYMNGLISHQEYYENIATIAGIAFNPHDPFIIKVKKALKNGDKHLNTIPLKIWDMKAIAAEMAIREAIRHIEGEFYSLSVGVCTMKEAARKAANS